MTLGNTSSEQRVCRDIVASAALTFGCTLALLIQLVSSAAAEGEASTEPLNIGTINLTLRIDNRSSERLICEATIAHWFSMSLPAIDPGEAGNRVVVFDKHDGTISVPGPTGELMAIETLWCGIAGRAWETRSLLALDRSRFDRAEQRHFHCTVKDSRLHCRRQAAVH